jgi:hypothetical protein
LRSIEISLCLECLRPGKGLFWEVSLPDAEPLSTSKGDQVAESWSELLAERCTAGFLHGSIILRLVIFALGVARFSSNPPACRAEARF